MVFPSFVFLTFFFPALLILYYSIFRNNLKQQNTLLLIASLFFYSWGEVRYFPLMLFSTAVDYVAGRGIEAFRSNKRACKAFLVMSMVFNIGVLLFFKYSNFIIENVNLFFGLSIGALSLTLPLGISFYTFQTMSYTIDVYRGKVEAQHNFVDYATFVTLFPMMIAGPIVRYETIANQLTNRKFDWDDFASGISRFIIGLGKKVVVANVIARAADYTFGQDPATLSITAAWLGAAAYGLQIYYDFSGYSDMAIGLGKIFGFHFPDNFNYPYISRSISEFWRRWHISLSTWFRDYVYFPLGGSRVNSKARLLLNLFIVWALTGLWHGASWTFVGWGLMFFLLIAFEKVTKFGKWIEKLPAIGNLYMLAFVLMGWVLFRASGGQYAIDYLLAMIGLKGNSLISQDTYMITFEYAFTWIIAMVGCLPIAKALAKRRFFGTFVATIFRWAYLAFIMLLSLAMISGSNYNPFIYFNF